MFTPQGVEEIGINLKEMMPGLFSRRRRQKATVAQAREMLVAEESEKLLDQDKVVALALERVQQTGIIFLDEIDKIAARNGGSGQGPDVSRGGVQRDLLPIVEGSAVTTKYGVVKTDHILFIAAGAFHETKVSDLIPELQGRFPIRVELETLGEGEFLRILTEPETALTKQYTALLGAEGLTIRFREDAIVELARIAVEVNRSTENIGARRLATVIERLLEEVSFEAPGHVREWSSTSTPRSFAEFSMTSFRIRISAAMSSSQPVRPVAPRARLWRLRALLALVALLLLCRSSPAARRRPDAGAAHDSAGRDRPQGPPARPRSGRRVRLSEGDRRRPASRGPRRGHALRPRAADSRDRAGTVRLPLPRCHRWRPAGTLPPPARGVPRAAR
jgi:hypothetical protein